MARSTTRTQNDISTNPTTTDRTPSSNSNTLGTAKLTSGLNVLVGLWLIISPWVIGYTALDSATWNSIIVGAVVAILAALRIAKPVKSAAASWVNLALGVWMIIAAFVIPHAISVGTEASTPFWNAILSGAAIVILALLSADSVNNAIKK